MVSVRRFVIQPLRRPPLRRPPLPARSRALPSAESGKARRLLCRAGDSTRSSPNPRHGARRLPGFRSGPRPAVPPASGGFAADGSAGSGVLQQGERGYPAPSRDPPLRRAFASFRLSGDRLARAALLRFRKSPRRPLRFPETRSAGSAVPGEPPLRSAAPLVAGCCSRGNAGTRRRLVIRPLRQAIAPFRATGHPGSSPA